MGMKSVVAVVASLTLLGSVSAQGIQPTYVPKFDMKFPGGGQSGPSDASDPTGQWAGLGECVTKLNSEGRSKTHVFNPSKETKVVTCAKVQFGEILHQAKYEAVFYMTVQGGKDFELPEYRNGNQLEAANSPAWCDHKEAKKQTMCCDAWLWDSSYI